MKTRRDFIKSLCMFGGAVSGVFIAGKVVAGDSFSPRLIEQDRNKSARQDIEIHIQSDNQRILKVIKADIKANGTLAKVLKERGEL